MTAYLLLLLSTALVNNVVLIKFLGLCPFMGVSKSMDSALGMGLADTIITRISQAGGIIVRPSSAMRKYETADMDALVERKVIEKYSLTGRQAILYFESLKAGQTVNFSYHVTAKFPIKASSTPARAG